MLVNKKVIKFLLRPRRIIKEKISNKGWLLDAVIVTSIFTLLLSVLSFGISHYSTQSDTDFLVKNIETIQFNVANSAISRDNYDFQRLYFALYSYYLAADRYIDTTTLWNIRTGYMREGNDFDKYYNITSNSAKEINDKIHELGGKRNKWNVVGKYIFVIMVLVQIPNIWFAYRLEKLDQTKEAKRLK